MYQKHDADANGNQGSEGLKICAGTGSYGKRESKKCVGSVSTNSEEKDRESQKKRMRTSQK